MYKRIYIYLVFAIPPGIAVTETIKFIKTQLVKNLKAKFFYAKTYARKGSIWLRGY